MDKVKKNNLNRFNILEALYNADSPNKIIEIESKDFLEKNNMTEKEKDDAIRFLIDKGLAEDFGNSTYSFAKITTSGIEEYERLYNRPDSPSNYFPAKINFINIGNITNSQIQQGDYNNQSLLINENDIDEINTVLKLLNVEYEKIKDELEKTARNIIDDNIKEIKNDLLTINKKNVKERIKILFDNIRLVSMVSDNVQKYLMPLGKRLYDFINNF